MNQLGDQDRDYTIRTILGEAADQGETGQAAVAHVIRNRLNAGGYGNTAAEIVTAPKQFTPWQTRRRELMSYAPDDPDYQAVGNLVDGVFGGSIPDPTKGATHFAQVESSDPSNRRGWIAQMQGNGTAVKIGAHTFGNPNPQSGRKQMAASQDIDVWGDIDKRIGGNATLADPGTTSGPMTITVRPNNSSGEQVDVWGDIDKRVAANAQPETETGSPAVAAIGGYVEGFPIVGAPLYSGIKKTAAAIRSTARGSSYDDELAGIEKYADASKENNKLMALAGNVAGGVAGLLPIAATGAGGAALGLVGSLPVRAGAGMLSGAGIGAADAYMRGNDPTEAAKTGAYFGGGLPVAGRMIGMAAATPAGRAVMAPVKAVGQAISNQFSGVARANNALVSAIEAGGQDAAALRVELQRNPNLTLADLNPAMREQLAGVAQHPEQAPAIRAWVDSRQAAAPDAVRGAFSGTMGDVANPVALRESLAQTAAANARVGFGAALKDARPGVDLAGVPEPYVKKINDVWDRIIKPFPDKAALTQPEQMHLVQTELRQEAEALAKSPNTYERLAAPEVGKTRQALIDKIDDAAGGKYRPAQKQYADDMSVREAFDNGMSFRQQRKGAAGLEDHPEALRRDWAGMTDAEKHAYRQGMRVEVDRVIETARNPATAGAAIDDAGFSHAKLEIAFGKKDADALALKLSDAKRMAETNRRASYGSDTQRNRMASDSVAIRGEGAPAPNIELAGAAGAVGGMAAGGAVMAVKGGNRLLRGGLGRADRTRNRLIGEDLTAAGPGGEAVLDRLAAFQAQRAAPNRLLGNIANDPNTNLLLQSAGRQYYGNPAPPMSITVRPNSPRPAQIQHAPIGRR